MLSLMTSKVYMVIIAVLLVVIIGFGIKVWGMSSTVTSLGNDKARLETTIRELSGSLALSGANEELLRISIGAQNARVASMQVDLDKAKSQYRVEEKRIYETIYSERVVLNDLNASEDCNHTKRIADEIIDLW